MAARMAIPQDQLKPTIDSLFCNWEFAKFL